MELEVSGDLRWIGCGDLEVGIKIYDCPIGSRYLLSQDDLEGEDTPRC